MDHEGLLLALARGHQGIGPLLQTFFSFLASRTDFFHILEDGGPSMGFAAATAEAMVAEAFGLAQLSYRLAKQPHLLPPPLKNKSLQDLQAITRDFNSRDQPTNAQYASPICRLAVVASLPDFFREEAAPSSRASRAALAAKLPAAAQAPHAAGPSKGTSKVESSKEGKFPVSADSCDPPLSATHSPANRRQKPQGPENKHTESSNSSATSVQAEKSASFINPWNGAILDRYVWSQSINEATCQVRLLELLQQQRQRKEEDQQQITEVNSKLLSVALKDDSVRVTYQGHVAFEGKWCHPIQSSESFWVLEQKAFLLFSLEKKKELWWDCLIEGDPTIDTTKVESVKRVEEFDEATQGHIRKIVYEQSLKMQGLKTPEEIQQENILRQAWDMEGSPFKGKPFDPSVLKPQSFGPASSASSGIRPEGRPGGT